MTIRLCDSDFSFVVADFMYITRAGVGEVEGEGLGGSFDYITEHSLGGSNNVQVSWDDNVF